MSVTLVTGLPGHGKTLYLVTELMQSAALKGRPLFVGGIPDLKLPFIKLPPVSEWTELRQIPEMPEGTQGQVFTFPENSVLILDEAQYTFPPRVSTSRPPPIVEAQTTHRHGGLDIFLLTQHPSFMDRAVLRLVDRHIHIRRVWGMHRAIIYQWDRVSDNLANLKQATKKVWKYPRKGFALYRSATVHTDSGQRPPFIVWMVGILALAAVGMGYYTFDRIGGRFDTTPAVATTPDMKLSIGQTQSGPGTDESRHLDLSILALNPVNPDRPETAPAYAGLVSIQNVPVVSGCVASSTRCICYSQQGTRLDIPNETCLSIAKQGRFDLYGSTKPSTPAPPVPAQPEQVVTTEPATWTERVHLSPSL